MSATHTAAVRIATRKSRLALAQADLVASLLARVTGSAHVLVEITTKGDALRDRSIAAMGSDGVFVKELENALLDDRADIAVHSLKDVPTEASAGLETSITLERGDARDALITRQNRFPTIESLPRGAIVGTSSLRRRAQLLGSRPDLEVRELRGNVDTRVRAVLDGRYDAAVLAVAGMDRIGILKEVDGGAPLDPSAFVPAPGQGAICIQYRTGDDRIANLLAPVQHAPTAASTTMERTFLRQMGGGCLAPIGAFATVIGDRATLCAFVGSPNGEVSLRRTIACDAADALQRATTTADEMLDAGGRAILALCRTAETKA
jgi:hydroxymethylbilane synthase